MKYSLGSSLDLVLRCTQRLSIPLEPRELCLHAADQRMQVRAYRPWAERFDVVEGPSSENRHNGCVTMISVLRIVHDFLECIGRARDRGTRRGLPAFLPCAHGRRVNDHHPWRRTASPSILLQCEIRAGVCFLNLAVITVAVHLFPIRFAHITVSPFQSHISP
jgi:hypothetical protein